MLGGFFPVVSELNDAGVLIDGFDYIAGEPTSRWLGLAGFLSPIGGTGAMKAISKSITKSKWWHPNYVDDLGELQILLGVKRSGKGNSTLGSSTRENAINAGMQWVGEGAKEIIVKGEVIGYKSMDKMKAFRIGFKKAEGNVRANFQENVENMIDGGRTLLKNVHIDIFD